MNRGKPPWQRKPVFETYRPPRLDSHLEEARVFMTMTRIPNEITAAMLRAQFNLRPETAQKVIDDWRTGKLVIAGIASEAAPPLPSGQAG